MEVRGKFSLKKSYEDRNEKHLLTLERIITELKGRRLSIEYQLEVLEHEYKVTMELIQKKNETHLKKVGLIK